MTHKLKCWPVYFDPIRRAVKSFEVRNNDRDFKAGDTLVLEEYEPVSKKYTGRVERRLVTYVLKECDGLMNGFVCMSIIPPMPSYTPDPGI